MVMCEALLFAQAGGVDLEKTLEAVSGGAAGSWMLSQRGPQVIRRDWQPGFTIDLQLKSISAVLKTAADNGVPVTFDGPALPILSDPAGPGARSGGAPCIDQGL